MFPSQRDSETVCVCVCVCVQGWFIEFNNIY